jgi:hypothetical protein
MVWKDTFSNNTFAYKPGGSAYNTWNNLTGKKYR